MSLPVFILSFTKKKKVNKPRTYIHTFSWLGDISLYPILPCHQFIVWQLPQKEDKILGWQVQKPAEPI
jgi:hypothetical protein